MKCIKCGHELTSIFKENGVTIPDHVGYQCVNPDCEIYNQSWSVQDNKDNQDWNVRHTRALEQRVQTLEASLKEQQVEISQLLKRLGV